MLSRLPASARAALSLAGIVALGLGAHLLAALALDQRDQWPSEENYVVLPSADSARFSYLGYNEVAADITWSRLLVYYGSGFLGEGDFRYLGKFVRNVITLDPSFKKPYQWASYSVTVTAEHKVSTAKEDILQSIEILEKAMIEFPDDYEFFWLAGIRYFLDLKSEDPEEQRRFKERGAELFEEAMSKPNAPKDLATKAAAFRTLLGQNEQARANLMQMIMTTDDAAARETMLQSFKSIDDGGVAEELQLASEKLREEHQGYLPAVPLDLFIVLGGSPPAVPIDFDTLATERDLFGAEDEGLVLFPK